MAQLNRLAGLQQNAAAQAAQLQGQAGAMTGQALGSVGSILGTMGGMAAYRNYLGGNANAPATGGDAGAGGSAFSPTYGASNDPGAFITNAITKAYAQQAAPSLYNSSNIQGLMTQRNLSGFRI